MTKEELISNSYEVFSGYSRPEHFTDYMHCEECKEHDKTMLSHSLSDLGVEELNNPGWSPIPFLSEEAFSYVLPRLIEMALSSQLGSDTEPFIFSYLLAITPLKKHRDFDYLNYQQAQVIRESVYYIDKKMAKLVAWECCESDLSEAIRLWNEISPITLLTIDEQKALAF